jgi:hypothetical protein
MASQTTTGFRVPEKAAIILEQRVSGHWEDAAPGQAANFW